MAPEIDTCPAAIHVTYLTKERAEAAVRHIAAKRGQLCHVLRCRTCGHWRVEPIR